MITLFQKLTLGGAGLVALGIGATIAIAPDLFYASYGIALGPDPDQRSELRAPAANLVALGALILGGAVWSSLTRTAALVGTILFTAYAVGRLLGIGLDGMPSDGIVQAMVIELAIGGLCALALRRSEAGPVGIGHRPGLPG